MCVSCSLCPQKPPLPPQTEAIQTERLVCIYDLQFRYSDVSQPCESDCIFIIIMAVVIIIIILLLFL